MAPYCLLAVDFATLVRSNALRYYFTRFLCDYGIGNNKAQLAKRRHGLGKPFGHAVMEATLAQSESGLSPAERGFGSFVLSMVTS